MAKKGWGKFVLGAGIGAGLGMLFAPKSGSETRKELKAKIDDLVAKAKELDMNDVTEQVENKIKEIKKDIKELDKEKVLKFAKQKGEALKDKASELVDLAKEKGTPVLKDAADEVKAKAINVAKEVIARLEKEEK
jgi:gas vesicle protein